MQLLTDGVTLDGGIQLKAVNPQKEFQHNADNHDHIQSGGDLKLGDAAVETVVQIHRGVLHH